MHAKHEESRASQHKVNRLEIANKPTNSKQKLRSCWKKLLLASRGRYQLPWSLHASIHSDTSAEKRSKTDKSKKKPSHRAATRSLCSSKIWQRHHQQLQPTLVEEWCYYKSRNRPKKLTMQPTLAWLHPALAASTTSGGPNKMKTQAVTYIGCLFIPGRVKGRSLNFLIEMSCMHNLLSQTVYDRLPTQQRQ